MITPFTTCTIPTAHALVSSGVIVSKSMATKFIFSFSISLLFISSAKIAIIFQTFNLSDKVSTINML